MITSYHPSGSILDKIISNNWDLLDRSSSTRPLLDYRIIKGFRRPKNVRDILIRAATENPWDVQGPPLVKDPLSDPNNRACTRNTCRYCDRLDKGGRLECPLASSTYTTICKCNFFIVCFNSFIVLNNLIMDVNNIWSLFRQYDLYILCIYLHIFNQNFLLDQISLLILMNFMELLWEILTRTIT